MRAGAVVLVAVATLAGLTAAVGSGGTSRIVLDVSPRDALIDQPVAILLSGLAANSTATLTATTTDAQGHRWQSSAVYRANDAGIVTPGGPPAPLSGTYRGVDPMGLFWSMHEFGVSTPVDEQALDPPTVSKVRFQAFVRGKPAAAATLIRRWHAADVVLHRTTLARDSFVGCYWSPASTSRPMPAVLYFGGSAGGLPCSGLIASHGYPELDLAYFNNKGLPAQLRRIPLEYFEHALEWLAKQPGVDPERLVAWGVSRGEEAALLLGTSYPSLVHGVVGYVGSNLVFGDPLAPDTPAWTLGGKAIPIGTQIPVDEVNGPLFLVGAGNDALGPSAADVENMAATLRAHNRHDFTALTYARAGHAIGIGIPNLPVASTNLSFGFPLTLGGTPAADARAREDSWPKLLAFLAKL